MRRSSSIVEDIKAIQPRGEPVAMNVAFPPAKNEWRALIDDADMVIECTGDDEALLELQEYPWPNSRQFVSFSLGWKAARLYYFSCLAPYFSVQIFREHYAPWKALELADASHEEIPWEGIGCWHPVFPARAEDVMLGAALAVKFVEAAVLGDKGDHFQVYSLEPSTLKLARPFQ
ncbi:MAG: hypothetical protein NVV74_24380 [Magnetospirillum sp.]|nr:hypothetical protein [Magnetospirillum sp.]